VCKALLSGLDWITGEQQGMSLVPCGHVLDTPPWHLDWRGWTSNGRVKAPSFRNENS